MEPGKDINDHDLDWNLQSQIKRLLHGSVVMNPTSIHKDAGLSKPGLAQWVNNTELLWLWCRWAAAALIQTLDWYLPYATGAALKKSKNKTKPKNQRTKQTKRLFQ